MMILSSSGSSSLDFSSIHVGKIFGLIIHFIIYMTCALAVIYTKSSFNYIISYTLHKTVFTSHILVLTSLWRHCQ